MISILYRKRKKENIAYVLFAKIPLLGYTKTRLEKDLKDSSLVLEIYKWMLRVQVENLHCIAKHHDETRQKRTSFFHFIAHPIDYTWKNAKKSYKQAIEESPYSKKLNSCTYVSQGSGSLGKKLEVCVEGLLASFDRVVISGADVPALYIKHFTDPAFLKPQSVIIPAHDGGYGLISFHKESYKTGCLQNITWSATHTYKDQIANFKKYKMPYLALQKVPDLDNAKDILRNILYMKNEKNSLLDNRTQELNQILKNNLELKDKDPSAVL